MTSIIEESYYKIRFGKYGLSVSENYGMKAEKKKISLYSRINEPRRLTSQERNKKSSSKS